MRQLYGQLVEAFGFRDVRQVSLSEVEEYVAYRNAPVEEHDDEADDRREMTAEEHEQLVRSMQANAEQFGRKKPSA